MMSDWKPILFIIIVSGGIALPITPPDPISFYISWIALVFVGCGSFYLGQWRNKKRVQKENNSTIGTQ